MSKHFHPSFAQAKDAPGEARSHTPYNICFLAAFAADNKPFCQKIILSKKTFKAAREKACVSSPTMYGRLQGNRLKCAEGRPFRYSAASRALSSQLSRAAVPLPRLAKFRRRSTELQKIGYFFKNLFELSGPWNIQCLYTHIRVSIRYPTKSGGKFRRTEPKREKEAPAGSERRPRKLHTYGNTDESVDKPSAAGRYGRTAAKSRLEDGERLLFTVVCDLSPTGGYSDSGAGAVILTDTCCTPRRTAASYGVSPYTDIAEAAVKRMYEQCAADDAQKRRRDGAAPCGSPTRWRRSAIWRRRSSTTSRAAKRRTASRYPQQEAAFDRMKLVCIPSADDWLSA